MKFLNGQPVEPELVDHFGKPLVIEEDRLWNIDKVTIKGIINYMLLCPALDLAVETTFVYKRDDVWKTKVATTYFYANQDPISADVNTSKLDEGVIYLGIPFWMLDPMSITRVDDVYVLEGSIYHELGHVLLKLMGDDHELDENLPYHKQDVEKKADLIALLCMGSLTLFRKRFFRLYEVCRPHVKDPEFIPMVAKERATRFDKIFLSNPDLMKRYHLVA